MSRMFRHGKVILVLLTLGLIAFGNSLTKPFVWDEYNLIVDNPLLKGWNPLRLLSAPFFTGEGWGRSNFITRYRPFTTLTFWSDYHLWGLNPFGYHLTSLALHLVNGSIFYAVIALLTRRHALSFLIAAFFLIHPIHPQAVAYIPSRGDLLAALWILILLFIHVAWREQSRFSLGILAAEMGALAAAMLSKESAIAAPAVLWGYELTYGCPQRNDATPRKALRTEAVALGSVILAYLAMRSRWFPLGGVEWWASWESRMTLFGQTMTLYLRWLLVPIDIRFPVRFKPQFPVWVGITWLFTLVMATAVLVRTKTTSGWANGIRFGLLWGISTLLLQSNLFFTMGPPFAAQYLYLPFMGLALASGIAGAWVLRNFIRSGVGKATMSFLGLLLALWWLGHTWRLNQYWGDPEQLFQTSLEAGPPNSTIGYGQLSSFYLAQGKPEIALRLTLEGIQEEPRVARFYVNLGLAYGQLGRLEEAEAALKAAVEIDPRDAASYNNLAAVYLRRRRFSEAIEASRRALERDPSFAEGYGNLGQALWELGQRQEAVAALEKAIRLQPDLAEFHMAYGDYLMEPDRPSEAVTAYQNLVHLMPTSTQSYTRLARAYLASGQTPRAIRVHQEAVRLRSDDPDAHFNYGVTLANLHRFDEARAQWEKTLELDPTREDARRYLEQIAVWEEGGKQQKQPDGN